MLVAGRFQYFKMMIITSFKSDVFVNFSTLVQNVKSGDATFLNTDFNAVVYLSYHIVRIKRTKASVISFQCSRRLHSKNFENKYHFIF